jgi:hypothetical protein
VHVQRCNHRGHLWKVETEFAADADSHEILVSEILPQRGVLMRA